MSRSVAQMRLVTAGDSSCTVLLLLGLPGPRAGARPRPRARRMPPARHRLVVPRRGLAAGPPGGLGVLGRDAPGERRRTRRNPVPRYRWWSWLAGLVALHRWRSQSPIERYDTTLFSVHMVQHLLLALVAAPLLVLGAPDHAAAARRHPAGPAAQDPAGPPLAGRARAREPARDVGAVRGVMWGSHFSPAVRCGAGGSVPPPRWSTACSWRGAALLVAGRRRGPEPATGCRTRRGWATWGWGCRSGRSWGWPSSPRRPCCIRTTPTLGRTWGPTPTRGPGAGRRHHVGRRRPRVPGRAGARGRRLAALEEAAAKRVDRAARPRGGSAAAVAGRRRRRGEAAGGGTAAGSGGTVSVRTIDGGSRRPPQQRSFERAGDHAGVDLAGPRRAADRQRQPNDAAAPGRVAGPRSAATAWRPTRPASSSLTTRLGRRTGT